MSIDPSGIAFDPSTFTDPGASSAATAVSTPAAAPDASSTGTGGDDKKLFNDYDQWLQQIGWGSGLAGNAPQGFDAQSFYKPGGSFFDAPQEPAAPVAAPVLPQAAPAGPTTFNEYLTQMARDRAKTPNMVAFEQNDTQWGNAPEYYDANAMPTGYDGLTPWTGKYTFGLRGAADNQWGVDMGGENASWAINPLTGQEEPVFRGPGGMYFLSQLYEKYGDFNNFAGLTDGYDEQGNPNQVYQTGIWGARPGNDFLGNPEEDEAFIRTVGPMIAALFTAGATAPESGAAAGGEAATAGGGEVGSGYAASAPGQSGMFANVPSWAMNAGVNYGINALGGASPTQALRSAATSGAIGLGAETAAPYVNDALDSYNTPEDYRRLQVADAGTGMFDVQPALSGPASVIDSNGIARSAQPNVLGGYSAPAAGQSIVGDPLNGGMLGSAASGLMPPAQTEQGDPTAVPQEAAPSPAGTATQTSVSPEQLERYAKVAQQVNALIQGGDGNTLPPRAEDQTEGQYEQQVVDYLGLDAQTMADAGLQPGTPEYMDYILQQADSIIKQVIGDNFEMSDEELSTALKDKTQEELRALQRALFVRGQLGMQAGSGTYKDPATGENQEVIGDGMFNPAVGAYQQGVAGSVGRLAGMNGGGAYDYLQQLLGRNSDMFGMQQAQDDAFERAKLDENDETRRRRGMLG